MRFLIFGESNFTSKYVVHEPPMYDAKFRYDRYYPSDIIITVNTKM